MDKHYSTSTVPSEYTIQVKVPHQLVRDTLITAFEQGSRYWIRKLNFTRTDWHVTDLEGKVCPVNEFTIPRGLATMARDMPARFGELASGRGDAETADLLLQFVCFGKLVYA